MDYGDYYDFSDWLDDSYGDEYIPAEGSWMSSGNENYSPYGGLSYNNDSIFSDYNTSYDYIGVGSSPASGEGSGYSWDYDYTPNLDYSGSGNFYGTSPQFQEIDTANPFGSISTTLSSIFNDPNAMKLGTMGLSALLEGYQNKKKAAAMQQAAKQIDPWASQRPFYQQQAQAAVTNPYDSPIVKAQIEQLQQAQNIKDAAAGRRSNMLTSSPAVMAEMAKIAQAYQAQMANQGGASIQPSGLAQTLGAASTYDANGYLSPLAALLGNYAQSNVNKAA